MTDGLFPVLTRPHKLYAYRVDDWLVIRTDMAGHTAVVNTEMWPEWTFEQRGLAHPTQEELLAVVKVARDEIEDETLWQGCAEGWCGLCALTDDYFFYRV